MRLNKTIALVLVGLLYNFHLFGQLEENHLRKENYYQFPIKPGIRNTLAGTMGELRSSHFHSGIDIRTDSRIGLAVHAAAEGYVSRVVVSGSGYGNALYVLHPNGHTTVYAHLDHFNDDIAAYARKEQYKKKTFEINLFPKKGQFTVSKGDIIAYGGNSGSSGGPHLHFDIRDQNQKPLNPLKYGFEEIIDTTPPVASKIAIKTLNKNARVNGQFGRFEFALRRIGNNYVIDRPIEVSGLVGVELYAYDKLDNARFRCGINVISMEVDSEKVFSQEISTFSFAEQRNILKHMNYADLHDSGERFHKLYVDDGNKLNFYTTGKTKGKLHFNDSLAHQVVITMTDSYDNVSDLKLKLQSVMSPAEKINAAGHFSGHETELVDNTLLIKTVYNSSQPLVVYDPQIQRPEPDYIIGGQYAVYLWDMNKGLPHSADINGKNVLLHYKEKIPSETSFKYYSDKVDMYFPNEALFDTLYLKWSHYMVETEQREEFSIGDQHIPLRKNISVTLKPELSYEDQEKYAVYAVDKRGNKYYKGGNWEYGRITFLTRDFGNFTIMKDNTPPSITPVQVDRSSLRFKISDSQSGIDEIKCYVNGEWVLMNYDYKTRLIWSEKLDDSQPFAGELKLMVTDKQGNAQFYTKNL